MKCVPVHHGIPAVLHRDEPWLHRHIKNGALGIGIRPAIFQASGNIPPEKDRLNKKKLEAQIWF